MDVYQAIEKRRSVRAFKDEEVSEESLKKILEAGRLAPSSQLFKVSIKTKKEEIGKNDIRQLCYRYRKSFIKGENSEIMN